jgi:molecular chaperone DnaK (HSP70)
MADYFGSVNDDGDQNTPSVVAFNRFEVVFGNAAKRSITRNADHTITAIKRSLVCDHAKLSPQAVEPATPQRVGTLSAHVGSILLVPTACKLPSMIATELG